MLLLPIKLPSSPPNPAQTLDSGDPPAAVDPTGVGCLGGLLLLRHTWGGGSLPCHVCLLPPRAATKVKGGFLGDHSTSGLQTSAPLAHLCRVPRSSAPCQICIPELGLNYPMLKQIHPWQIQLLKRKEDEFEGFSSQRGRLGCWRR